MNKFKGRITSKCISDNVLNRMFRVEMNKSGFLVQQELKHNVYEMILIFHVLVYRTLDAKLENGVSRLNMETRTARKH